MCIFVDQNIVTCNQYYKQMVFEQTVYKCLLCFLVEIKDCKVSAKKLFQNTCLFYIHSYGHNCLFHIHKFDYTFFQSVDTDRACCNLSNSIHLDKLYMKKNSFISLPFPFIRLITTDIVSLLACLILSPEQESDLGKSSMLHSNRDRKSPFYV